MSLSRQKNRDPFSGRSPPTYLCVKVLVWHVTLYQCDQILKLKVAQFFPKVAPKVATAFLHQNDVFTLAQIDTLHLVIILRKFDTNKFKKSANLVTLPLTFSMQHFPFKFWTIKASTPPLVFCSQIASRFCLSLSLSLSVCRLSAESQNQHTH